MIVAAPVTYIDRPEAQSVCGSAVAAGAGAPALTGNNLTGISNAMTHKASRGLNSAAGVFMGTSLIWVSLEA